MSSRDHITRTITGNNAVKPLNQMQAVPTHHHTSQDVDGLQTVIDTVNQLVTDPPTGSSNIEFVEQEW